MYRMVWKSWEKNLDLNVLLLIYLPLEAEDGKFSPRLFCAAAVVGPMLHMKHPCSADPQACPTLVQKTCHPVVGKIMYCTILNGCLFKDNISKFPHLP